MGFSMNYLFLSGNVGKEPELKYLQDGRAVASFSLAVSQGKDSTAWYDVTAFGKTAEFMGEVPKGSRLMLAGRLQQDSWVDAESGKKRRAIKVIADRVELPPRNNGGHAETDEEPNF